MDVYFSLDEKVAVSSPVALLIGNFDGVHLGHQSLLKRARECVGPKGNVAVLTFQNHPWSFFNPHSPVPLIYPFEERLALLEKAGVEVAIALPFDQKIANLSYLAFLEALKRALPFDFLILGEGARIGKGREGDEQKVRALEGLLGFRVEYLPKVEFAGMTVSSGKIRKFIQDGKFEEASLYLGRRYSPLLKI